MKWFRTFYFFILSAGAFGLTGCGDALPTISQLLTGIQGPVFDENSTATNKTINTVFQPVRFNGTCDRRIKEIRLGTNPDDLKSSSAFVAKNFENDLSCREDGEFSFEIDPKNSEIGFKSQQKNSVLIYVVGQTIFGPTQASTINLEYLPVAPFASFKLTSVSQREVTPQATIDLEVFLSEPLETDSTVDFTLTPIGANPAMMGLDYMDPGLSSITFLAGEISKTIQIPVNDDGNFEGVDETCVASISNPTGEITTVLDSVVSITIEDNDAQVTLNSPTPNNFINQSNFNSYPVSGTCSDATSVVRVTAPIVAETGCNNGIWSMNLNLSSAGDAPSMDIDVFHSNQFGESANAAQTYIKDTIAPTVDFGSLANVNSGNESNYSASGTCSENGVGNVEITFANLPTNNVDCTAGTWSMTGVDLSSLPEGSIALSARLLDAVGNEGTNSDSINKATNVAPVLSFNCVTPFNEDTALSCSNSFTDANAGDTHTYSLSPAHNCSWISAGNLNASTGAISATPNDNEVGNCTVAIRVTDNRGAFDEVSQLITVNNLQPVFTPSIANATLAEDSPATIIRTAAEVSVSDEGFGNYSILPASSSDCQAQGSVSIDASSGAITYALLANYNGVCQINVQFNDLNSSNNLVTDEFSVTVTDVNDTPTITQSCATAIDQDLAYSCSPTVNDLDTGNSHSWSFDASHSCGAWLSINNGTGVISGTPNDDDVGTCNLAFIVNDGTINSTVQTVSLTVNNIAPVFSPTIADASVNEDSGATIVRVNAEVNVSDEGFGTYSLIPATGTRCEDNGTVTIDSVNGEVTFDPDNNYQGVCNINVQFDDENSSGNLVSDEFSVTVNSINDAPTIVSHSCGTSGTEDAPYSCTITVNDIDMPIDTTGLQFDGNTCSWASISGSYPTFTITGTPDNSGVGACNLGFRAFDGVPETSATINVAVNVANVIPLLTIGNVSISEDAPAAEIRSDADVQATDEQQGSTTYSLDNSGATSPKCSDNSLALSINANTGAVTYQPALSYAGTCFVKVDFDDGHSGSATSEFSVTVNGSNDPPTITAESCSSGGATEDSLFSCNFTVNDPDIGDTVNLVAGPGHDCSWLGAPTGSYPNFTVSGTPTNSDVGTCNLEYKARDLIGAESAVDGDPTFSVANNAPTFTIADAFINEDAPLAVIRADGTVQASDEGQGDNGYAFNHASTTGTKCSDHAQTLTINAVTGEISYHPETNFEGPCNIRVTFDDANSSLVDAQFTVNFTGSNDPPVITYSCAATVITQDATYDCSGGEVSIVDPDGSTPTWSFVEPAHTCDPWMTINTSTGALSGTPNDDQVTSPNCTVAVKANDGSSDSNIEQFNIIVNNIQPSLSIVDVTGVVEDSSATVIRTAAQVEASDEGFGVYSIVAASSSDCNGAHGSANIDTVNGEITYTPASDFQGTCQLNVQFDDQNSSDNIVSEEFSVTVDNVNDLPTITESCLTSLNEDVAYNCSPSFSDPDTGQTHTWSLAGTNTCDWAAIAPSTGVISGTPDDDDVGSCSLEFLVNDSVASSTTTVVTVNVINIQPTLSIANTSVNEDAGPTIIRNDAEIQASDEGFGTYTVATATGTDCRTHGLVTIESTTGAVTYDPDQNFEGPCNINVQFDDGNASNNLASSQFTVNFNTSNDAPVLTYACSSTSVNQDQAYNCPSGEITLVDPDGGAPTYSFVEPTTTCDPWMTINASTGALGGIPNDDDVTNPTCTVSVKANDGNADSNIETFTVTVANLTPTLTISDPPDIHQGVVNEVVRSGSEVQASEEGFGVYSRIAASSNDCHGSNGSVSVNSSTGQVTFTPDFDYTGTCNINVQFDDQNPGGIVSDEFAVTVVPSGSIYSLDLQTAPLDSSVSFSRASTGTYFDKDGLLKTATNNQPRFEFDPKTRKPLGLLLEDTRTNLILRSEELNNGTWQKTSVTITQNSAIAPDGNTTADKIVENNSGSSQHVVRQDISLNSSTAYTASVYVKLAERKWLFLSTRNLQGGIHKSFFNLETGVVGANPDHHNPHLIELANGWWRVAVTFDSLSGGGSPRFSFGMANDSMNEFYGGDGSSGMYFWGAQLEKDDVFTSYIPTADSTATRQRDQAVITNPSLWYNNNLGSFKTVFNLPYDIEPSAHSNDRHNDQQPYVFNFFKDNDNRLSFKSDSDGAPSFFTKVATVDSTIRVTPNFTIADQRTGIITMHDSNWNIFMDGVIGEVGTTGSIAQDLTEVRLGYGDPGASKQFLNGHLREFTYWPVKKGNTTMTRASEEFNILGITGGADTTADQKLFSTLNPTVEWSDVSGETSYDATIYENDMVTVACATTNVTPNTTSYSFSSCTLANGNDYWVDVVAKYSDGEVFNRARNAYFFFSVDANTAPIISMASNCTSTTTFDQDTTYTCQPTVSNPDAGENFVWTVESSNTCSNMTITSGATTNSPVFQWAPNDDEVGACNFVFKVTDDGIGSLTDTETVALTVTNIAPTFTTPLTPANQILANTDGPIVIKTDSEVETDEESFGFYSVVTSSSTPNCTSGSHGTANITSSNGLLTFDPLVSFTGDCFIGVRFDDGNGGTVDGEVLVKVRLEHTWTGLDASDDWSDPQNWVGGIPSDTDLAIFDDVCSTSCDALIDSAISVGGIHMTSSYIGTITQGSGNTVTINALGFQLESGTFSGSDSNFVVADLGTSGSFNLSGGTFTPPSSELRIAGNFILTGGNWTPNNETINFIGNENANIDAQLASFNKIRFSKSGAPISTITGILTANEDVIFSSSSGSTVNGGAIHVGRSLFVQSGGGGTTGIKFYGGIAAGMNQTGGTIPTGTITFAKSSNSVQLENATTFNPSQDIQLTSGTLDLDGENITNGNFVLGSGTRLQNCSGILTNVSIDASAGPAENDCGSVMAAPQFNRQDGTLFAAGGSLSIEFIDNTSGPWRDYRYTTDGSPANCSNGTSVTVPGGPGSAFNITGLPNNGDFTDIKAVSCNISGVSSPETTIRVIAANPTVTHYYNNATDLMDYVADGDLSDRNLSACTGSGRCHHGGLVRMADIPNATSCNNIIASDDEGLFSWDCVVKTSPHRIEFISGRLNPGKRIGHALDSVSAWKNIGLSLGGTNVVGSVNGPSAPLWNNTLANLGGSNDLDSSGTVYVYDGGGGTFNRQNMIDVNSDKVALIKLNDDDVLERSGSWPQGCNYNTGGTGSPNASCVVRAANKKYLLMEYDVFGDTSFANRPDYGFFGFNIDYSTFQYIEIDSTNRSGIALKESSYNKLHQLELHNVANSATPPVGATIGEGLYLADSSDFNDLSNIGAYDNFKAGIMINNNSRNNRFFNIHTNHNYRRGLYVSGSTNNTFINISASSQFGTVQESGVEVGVGIDIDNAQDNSFFNVISTHNRYGVRLRGSAGSKGNFLNDVMTNSNSITGFLLEKGDENRVVELISVNNGSHGLEIDDSKQNDFHEIGLSRNGVTGVYVSGSVPSSSERDEFHGDFKTGANGSTVNCRDDNGAIFAVGDYVSCATQGLSQGNNFFYENMGTPDFTEIFNEIETKGETAIKWFTDSTLDGVLSFLTSWGRISTNQTYDLSDARGFCQTGSCSRWDWRIVSAGATTAKSRMQNKFSPGTVLETHSWDLSGTTDYYPNSREFMFDFDDRSNTDISQTALDSATNNGNGICEANEVCIYGPHWMPYDGHGQLRDSQFIDRIVPGGTVYLLGYEFDQIQ